MTSFSSQTTVLIIQRALSNTPGRLCYAGLEKVPKREWVFRLHKTYFRFWNFIKTSTHNPCLKQYSTKSLRIVLTKNDGFVIQNIESKLFANLLKRQIHNKSLTLRTTVHLSQNSHRRHQLNLYLLHEYELFRVTLLYKFLIPSSTVCCLPGPCKYGLFGIAQVVGLLERIESRRNNPHMRKIPIGVLQSDWYMINMDLEVLLT